MHDVLKFTNVLSTSLSEMQKYVVLQFDEVKVKSTYEYDSLQDEALGPYSQMQVVMARSLFGKWKQPVYIDFDQKMAPTILTDIIEELHKIKFTVVACVSDCGDGNVGLWKKLGISIDHTYFEHPITKENVYMFVHDPHTLKLVRNWLLGTGFILKDGTIINKEPLKKLLEITDSEVNVCLKVSEKHIDCEKTKGQNVQLAAELLSHTTATTLKFYDFGENSSNAVNCGNFIDLVKKWFHIMNSYVKYGSLPTKCEYDVNISEQNKILEEMYNIVNNMKCKGKSTLQIFQKGILISTSSLELLYEDIIKRTSGVEYILTQKLYQPSRANFFSQLRTRGGFNDHPTPSFWGKPQELSKPPPIPWILL